MKRVTYGVGLELDKANLPIQNVETLKRKALVAATSVFGGVTTFDASGAWQGDAGIALERAWSLQAYTDANEHKIKLLARYLRWLFHQASVLVAVGPVQSLTFV